MLYLLDVCLCGLTGLVFDGCTVILAFEGLCGLRFRVWLLVCFSAWIFALRVVCINESVGCECCLMFVVYGEIAI